MSGNGAEGGGSAPCFLELKRLMPRMRRERPEARELARLVAIAPAFVLSQPPAVANEEMVKAAYRAGEVPLPHDPCLIEIQHDKSPIVVLCRALSPDTWVFNAFARKRAVWMIQDIGVQVHLRSLVCEVAVHGMSPEEVKTMEDAAFVVGTTVLSAIWCVLHARDSTEVRTLGTTARALMQAKGLRGWQYRLVTITPELLARATRGPHGGTHASPRWHLRRAHIRHLKSGKVVAVRSCEVGSAEHGGIAKDYVLSQPPPEEPTS